MQETQPSCLSPRASGLNSVGGRKELTNEKATKSYYDISTDFLSLSDIVENPARHALALDAGLAETVRPSAVPEISSHGKMTWIEEHLHRKPQGSSEENTFSAAAHARWERLEEELRADVAAFNARQSGAEFHRESEAVFRVINSAAGLELRLAADFENRNVRYDYSALNEQNAGVPEGGILSMRQLDDGTVEFYSADEQLTPIETCNVLLEPVQFPKRCA